MDPHPTPFPGKDRVTKLKSNKKLSEPSKMHYAKEQGPPILRKKRLFGTAQNPNTTSKPLPEKPIKKPSSVVLKMTAKPLHRTQSKNEKKSTEGNGTQLRKKTVRFQENGNFKNEGNLVGTEVLEPQTPVRTPCVVKTRLLDTPYHTAERCSKCKGNQLETSLYWVGQIKLAESVGKHFVSAGFFRLALESKAEPFRNLRVELKKYLARHGYLSEDEEWRNLCVNYGLLKEQSNTGEENGEACANKESASVQDEEGEVSTKENGQACEFIDYNTFQLHNK